MIELDVLIHDHRHDHPVSDREKKKLLSHTHEHQHRVWMFNSHIDMAHGHEHSDMTLEACQADLYSNGKRSSVYPYSVYT